MIDRHLNSYSKKKNLRIPVITFLIAMIFLYACRKGEEDSSNSSERKQTFKTVFLSFWKGMNHNYVMWDIEETNWNEMRNQFQPAFEKLDINNLSDRLLAIKYLREMTKNLRDGHFNIQFDDSDLKDSIISHSENRLKSRKDYHEQFPSNYFDILADTYLDHPYYEADYNSDQFHQLRYRAGTIQNDIFYFRINSFAIYRAFKSGNIPMRKLLDHVFNNLRNNKIKGIIVDLRDNFGGDLFDLNFFVGRFTNRPLIYGSSRAKSNNNPFDYTPWLPATITPITGESPFNGKVVVLVNMYSVSMAELTAMAIKTLPNALIVGERTFGANGLLTSETDLNGGSFDIGNFATITLASAVFKYKNNQIYEGIGFPPDINIPYKIMPDNRDNQLDGAIEIIKGKDNTGKRSLE